MDLPKFFYQKPWHILLICLLVFTSTFTYLITSDLFRTDARTKLDICLYHLRQRQASAYRERSNQTCVHGNRKPRLPYNRDKWRLVLPTAKKERKCPNSSETVLILSPFVEIPGLFNRYLINLISLSYPHCLLRIAIGVDRTEDGSVEIFKKHVGALSHKFRSIEVHSLAVIDKEADQSPKYAYKHSRAIQFVHKRKLAKVRNSLLMSALRDEKYVLWLDSDIRELPADIIQTLISAHVPVVVPSCMYRKTLTTLEVYDHNSWRETEASRRFLRLQDANFLMLEGYGNSTLRKYLPQLSQEGRVVSLDGVGTCCMLVNANVHRQGALFPPYMVNHHIESEGFAQIAKLLDYKLYGMPRVTVIH